MHSLIVLLVHAPGAQMKEEKRSKQLGSYLMRLTAKQPHLAPVLATGHVIMAAFVDAMFCQVRTFLCCLGLCASAICSFH